MVGKSLAHYEILEPLGAGGMGEVYRAHDTTLKRDVAIKVLPEEFTTDKDRLARLEREAHLLASLNHPNIASIHSLEEAQETRFLVLELVEGKTLADRLVASGRLEVEEALEIARQIAEALEAAHEKGIIHRDLKPANVKVTPDGKVKVLDFGLAKAHEVEGPAGEISPDLTQSPTVAAGTRTGVILGTAAYMSPEQARGQPLDKRTDIWSFGCVVYEMLTGRRAFGAGTVSDAIAAILKDDPEWSALPDATPVNVRLLLRRCLQKEPRRRLRDIGDAWAEIDDALSEPPMGLPSTAATLGQPRLGRRAVLLSVAAAFALGAVVAGLAVWSLTRPTPSRPQPLTRWGIDIPQTGGVGSRGPGHFLALSPDGRHLVYSSGIGDQAQLYVRSMDRLEADPIPGTHDAHHPFFSPDGQWIGFFAEEKLKKISLSGGAPITLCEARDPRGATWARDDTIVFATDSAGLLRIPAAGGTPEVVAEPDFQRGEIGYRWPEALPDATAVLFTVWREGFEDASIAVLSLETGEQRLLAEPGTNPLYAPTGHIVFARLGSLFAVPFDLGRLQVSGQPVPMLEGVLSFPGGAANFSLSGDGSLVYIPGGVQSGNFTLVWVERDGTATPLTEKHRTFWVPRLSPDGQRLAVWILEGGRSEVWVYEIGRDTFSRLTLEGANYSPEWSPDGEWVVFSSDRGGEEGNLYRKPADFSGPAERLLEKKNRQFPGSFTPDGKLLAYTELHPTTGADIWVLPLEAEGAPQPLLATSFAEASPRFSPDGRWIAYMSEESGQSEVYVQPFPEPGGRWQVSDDGGTEPLWSRDGRELFYRASRKMMVVEVETEPEFSPGTARPLFEGPYLSALAGAVYGAGGYDVAADGQRFLMIELEEDAPALTQIVVVLNWLEELERLVPTNR